MVLHSVQSQFEVFAASKDGERVESDVPTTVLHEEQILFPWGAQQNAQQNVSFISKLGAVDPVAFYDRLADRFVAGFGTLYGYGAPNRTEGDPFPPLILCVSETNNPLGTYNCFALDIVTFDSAYLEFGQTQDLANLASFYPRVCTW